MCQSPNLTQLLRSHDECVFTLTLTALFILIFIPILILSIPIFHSAGSQAPLHLRIFCLKRPFQEVRQRI